MSGRDQRQPSFATLVAQAEHNVPMFGGPHGDEGHPFNQPGAGRFAAHTAHLPVEAREEEEAGPSYDDQEHEEGEEDSSNQHTPAIPLPDLVPVITGEEGWFEVFSERAKLYRFDRASEEWKERGVGKMKILCNEENGQYRLVMRREKVLKVICNHLLTPDVHLRPQFSSPSVWCWHVINFTESSSGCSEILAIRFPSKEAAITFKERVDRCIGQADT